MATTTIEITQDGGADETLVHAKRIFQERHPDKGPPTGAEFVYAYPASSDGKRTVGIKITH